MRRLIASSLLLLCASCVSGNKVRADSEVIQASIERARRSGAPRCAPVDLPTADPNLDFARGEIGQGASYRASEHLRPAEASIPRALELSRSCVPPKVVIGRDKPEPTPTTPATPTDTTPRPTQQQQVVVVEVKDTDGDGIPDKDDPCPDRAEDFDGFEDTDGCPDPDNDNDGVLDVHDKCPLTPGPQSNQGCAEDESKDTDGDGIPDVSDKCPLQPEDMDGFQDTDGCPDLDNDADGIPDAIDRCPLVAGPLENGGCADGDKDGDGIVDRVDLCPEQPGPQEMRGCPDPDKDGDGIVDRLDICPNEPGPHETRGCPDVDTDKDGIVDRLDICPNEPGTQELRGCPDPDRDHDGIPDRIDVCPEEPGVKEERGCAKKYKMVVVKKDKIQIKKQIKFASGSAKIIGKESFTILDDVGRALNDMPFIKKIRIEGHTDSVGKDVTNLKLSQARADAVLAELIKRKVDPGRLQAMG